MDSGETSVPEDDAFDDDEERAGIPNSSASERYRTASDGYTRKRGSTSLRHLEDEGDLDNPRLGWLVPDSAHAGAATGTDGLKPGRKEWQVNVRLDRIHYASLKRAADVYGTTPTALARMLLNRGAAAILNAYRAEQAEIDAEVAARYARNREG